MNPYAGYVLSSPFRTKTDTPTVTATPVATTEDTTEDITEEVTGTKTGGRIGTTIGGIGREGTTGGSGEMTEGMTGEISIMGSIKERVVTSTIITAEEIMTTADITIRKGPAAAVSDFIHECLSSLQSFIS